MEELFKLDVSLAGEPDTSIQRNFDISYIILGLFQVTRGGVVLVL